MKEVFTGKRNFISLLTILFLLGGCSGLSLNSNIKPISSPFNLIPNGPREGFNLDINLNPFSYAPTSGEIISSSHESDQSLDLSFEFSLKDYLKDSSPDKEILFSSNLGLFSFADNLLFPDESYLSEIRDVPSEKEASILKAKKIENKILIREEETGETEIKPYSIPINDLLEDHLPGLIFSVAPSQGDDFSWESKKDVVSDPDLGNTSTSSSNNNHNASSLVSLFPSVFHEKVKDFINYFQNKADSFFAKALARSQAYEEMMKRILREKNLPEDLFYLALIESGYNPLAVSRAQASGIWQFVSKTAKRFGLRVDKWVDERRDPEKSTYAAAEYLKQLYEMFNCWELATASYNAGEGKILKAMKKARSQNFWEIAQYRYLKPETKKYVPLFLAALVIAKEPEKYGFSNITYHPPLTYEKIIVPPATSLSWVAKLAETDLAELKILNPSLKLDKTPPRGDFEIKIPSGKKEIFERNFAAQQKLTSQLVNKHRVRPGETLGSIARKYRVNLGQLCELNGLSPKTKIKPGLVLLLPP